MTETCHKKCALLVTIWEDLNFILILNPCFLVPRSSLEEVGLCSKEEREDKSVGSGTLIETSQRMAHRVPLWLTESELSVYDSILPAHTLKTGSHSHTFPTSAPSSSHQSPHFCFPRAHVLSIPPIPGALQVHIASCPDSSRPLSQFQAPCHPSHHHEYSRNCFHLCIQSLNPTITQCLLNTAQLSRTTFSFFLI